MANPRALDRRRASIRNIRKITRTMELIATARFKKAMDRAVAATEYTRRIAQLVKDLSASGADLSHPLLVKRDEVRRAALLVLSSNRGLCGGYNGGVMRVANPAYRELKSLTDEVELHVVGKRATNAFRQQRVTPAESYFQFEDRPAFAEVDEIAARFLTDYRRGKLDRLDVVYTRFISSSRQEATRETLLPFEAIDAPAKKKEGESADGAAASHEYEFLPSAESILEEVVPASFKASVFKCFLDAAVSEQIARMVAMKSATENADDLIRDLSVQYNRARQGRITSELLEIIGGADALKQAE